MLVSILKDTQNALTGEFVYSTTKQSVIVSSDGGVLIKKAVGASKQGNDGHGTILAGNTDSVFKPGAALDDFEVERKLQVNGTLVRKLVSGRVEMYYTDGTLAYRNPVHEELEEAVHLVLSS